MYRPLIALRNLAFDRGWRVPARLPVPVISVGNLIAGGTGKTPVTRLIAERLRARGCSVAVLSRGYRGAADGMNEEAELLGDTPVFCDPRRINAGRRALAAGAEVLLLDDGFQHRQLHRDLNLVLIDATRPWGRSDGGRGAVLPLGYRREGMNALARADALWLTRCDLATPERLAALKGELTAWGKPLLCGRHHATGLSTLDGTHHATLSAFVGRRVVLASGIGNPAAFEALAAQVGLLTVQALRFPDHHHFTADDLRTVAAMARGGEAIVITAKDAVKWRRLAALPATEVWVLNVEQALDPADLATLDTLLQKALTPR